MAVGERTVVCPPVSWSAIHCLGAAPCPPLDSWPAVVSQPLCRLWRGVHGVAVDGHLLLCEKDPTWHCAAASTARHLVLLFFLDGCRGKAL